MQELTTSFLNDDDISAPFPTVGGPSDLLRSKLRLASYCQDRTFNPVNVLQRLRFLSVPVSKDGANSPAVTPSSSVAAPCDQCVCYPSFNDNNGSAQMRTLRLTDPGTVTDCLHYVAVSYCWRQPRVLLDEEAPATNYVIKDGDNQRINRVSPNIIRRAIDFAIEKNLRLIWLDQECIDQDDQQDKALHIQAMHLIFRRAQYVAAILNNALTEQWQADMLCHGDPLTLLDHIPLTRIADVAQWLADDIWYTRAWTYQEALLATRGIYLVIPCQPNLQTDNSQSVRRSQLLIRDHDLVMVFKMVPRSWNLEHINDDTSQDMDAGRLSSALDVLQSAVPAWKETPLSVALDHHRLSALDALRPLFKRDITETYDLIALCGNLCNYGVRLDANLVRHSGVGLSVALFTLGLLNGDMSLLLGYRSSRHSQFRGNSHEFHLASLKDIVTVKDHQQIIDWKIQGLFTCRIRPPQLLPDGLMMTGILWRVEYFDLNSISQRYGHYTEQLRNHYCERTIIEEIVNATRDFLQQEMGLDLSHLTNSFGSHSRQHLASQILAYSTMAVATSDDPAASGCMLLPRVARDYNRFNSNPDEEHEDCLPLCSADTTGYLFTPFRVLMEDEIRDQKPGFLLAWAIDSTESTADIIHIYSHRLPCKLKLDEASFVGDAERLIAKNPREERSYWLHCF